MACRGCWTATTQSKPIRPSQVPHGSMSSDGASYFALCQTAWQLNSLDGQEDSERSAEVAGFLNLRRRPMVGLSNLGGRLRQPSTSGVRITGAT